MRGFLFVFAALLLASQAPLSLAKDVEAKHRACKVDGDCAKILLKCACNFCRDEPDDLKTGRADSVNKQFVAEFADRAKCTAQETAQCALAGACPQRGHNEAVCRSGMCTLEFRGEAIPPVVQKK